MGYFSDIKEGTNSVLQGLRLTWKHFLQAKESRKPLSIEDKDYFTQDTGIVTTQYPYEAIPIPDNGRYRLHNEIDDCIVCDLCAKVCPVNCIDIIPIKSPEEIGKTSDGTTKRIYAATFDIDMAKCCYCGLCTTVCPTECLTMTKTFDYSEFDIRNMNYHFTDLTHEQAEERKKIYEQYEKEKQRLKEEAAKAKEIKADQEGTTIEEKNKDKKPAFKPVIKSTLKPENAEEKNIENISSELNPKPKPVFKPNIKAPNSESSDEKKTDDSGEVKPKPVFKPKIIIPPKKDESKEE